MTELHWPPKKDFDDFASLMRLQSGHFGTLGDWAGKECTTTGNDKDPVSIPGLDSGPGLLLIPIYDFAPQVSSWFTGKLDTCKSGMTDVAGRATRTGQTHADTEKANQDSIAKIYPGAISGFPDIGDVPGLSMAGDFNDQEIKLDDSGSATGDTNDAASGDIADDIAPGLPGLGGLAWKANRGKKAYGKDKAANAGKGPDEKPTYHNTSKWAGGQVLSTLLHAPAGVIFYGANSIFQHFTGESLVEVILHPIAGNWGILKFLGDNFKQLGTGTYTVAGTIRKATVRLGGGWQGDAATRFDSWMFRWSMGSGGVGDAAMLVGKTCDKYFDIINDLVTKAINLIINLIATGLSRLVKMVAGDAAIEALGGGPEDPVADVIAAAWTLYQIYEIIKDIISAIKGIIDLYDKIEKAISDFTKDVHEILSFMKNPVGNVKKEFDELMNEGLVSNKDWDFEEKPGWDPAGGVARVGLLPAP
ncbi:hypothetical protein AB0L06_19925 [Spirillospora sp. NPDC052269]